MRSGNKGDGKGRKRSLMLPESFIIEMREVRERIGAQSDSEVMRRAFQLYRKLISTPGEITYTDPQTGEKKVFVIPEQKE